MKKLLLFASVFSMTLLLGSCGKPMVAPEDLTCNPNPLTVVGDKVNATITGTFPVESFNKKATMVVTPVLKYAGTEVISNPITFVGEKVEEGGIKIAYESGSRQTITASFDYVPEMVKSELFLRFEVSVKGKPQKDPIADVKVADGVMATVKLTATDAYEVKPAITADKFQRIIQEVQEADIQFLIQQAGLRSSETRSQEVKDLTAAVAEADKNEKKAVNNFEISGYASPDGEMDLNTKLAERRKAATQRFMASQFRSKKLKVKIDSKFTAEDWDGFQKLMEASNIQDKELILRVLSMYSDPEQRELEIKNLSAAYKNIADEILPQLRRSRLKLTTDLIGKSDEEISTLVNSDPKQLSVEEMLYAATLVNTADEKVAIYKKVIDQFPDDYRGYNNLGIVMFGEGEVKKAAQWYAKALDINPNDPDVNFNAAVAAMDQDDLAKAEELFGKSIGTSSDLQAAMGTMYLKKGDYAKAKAAFGTANTNNAAIQLILNGDYNGARNALAAVAEPNATTAYLQAIVGARTNNRDAVYSNMKVAVAKDKSLATKAATDIEFAKFAADEQFAAIIK